MAARVRAIVKPELLSWARESAGLDVATAARKAGVTPERLKNWEDGYGPPSVQQLRKLARVYRRPLAAFYLPEPPKDFSVMHDFRRLEGALAGRQSPELRYAIRRARERRDIAIQLFAESGESPPVFDARATLSDSPDRLAVSIRARLGITLETQRTWQYGHESFNRWREALETSGILVFQVENVPLSEARGFSIAAGPLPAISVNIKDSPIGRTFTMLHELTHILLRQDSLCDEDESTRRQPADQRTEVFCNRVAGALLVPTDSLVREIDARSKVPASDWEDAEILSLARRFGASRETILRRLLICGRTSESFYKRKREQYLREYTTKANKAKSGYALPHKSAIARAGRAFVRLVLSNYHARNITASDVADFLDIRLKHLNAIEKDVG
jgi:Zn-dependent peptidase ImmA (M78 family)/DNA-binding XRE family transcriptional regulator